LYRVKLFESASLARAQRDICSSIATYSQLPRITKAGSQMVPSIWKPLLLLWVTCSTVLPPAVQRWVFPEAPARCPSIHRMPANKVLSRLQFRLVCNRSASFFMLTHHWLRVAALLSAVVLSALCFVSFSWRQGALLHSVTIWKNHSHV